MDQVSRNIDEGENSGSSLPQKEFTNRRTGRFRQALGAGVGATLLVIFALVLGSTTVLAKKVSASGRMSYPVSAHIQGTSMVGFQQCGTCHREEAVSFQHSVHALKNVECEDCHGGGSLHVKNPGKKNIVLLSTLTAKTANAVCLRCHETGPELTNWETGPHSRSNMRCTDCHNIHGTQSAIPSRQQLNALCTRCHLKQAAEENLPYHHPVLENKMTCIDCHDPHGGVAGNNIRANTPNQLCYKCHSEYQGPFIYQHPPVTESCLTCHNPHGSMNRAMLVVSEPMLCMQCHPAHHDGNGVPLLNKCTNCHNSIHGSDVASSTGGSVFIDKP